jgi:hypothetical protein
MSRLPLLIALALVLMATACTSGKKAYQKGNYSQLSFRLWSGCDTALTTRNRSKRSDRPIPLALETHTNEIEQLLRSADPIKYAKTVEQYEIMNHMAEEIRKCPAALEIFGTQHPIPNNSPPPARKPPMKPTNWESTS